MLNEQGRLGTSWRRVESETRPAPAPPEPAALIQSLLRLREHVLDRLESLEALARERTGSADADLARTLDRRRVELEEAERRLSGEAERREKEWNASLARLEADRLLLADAWERIEQERIAARGLPESQRRDPAHEPDPRSGAAIRSAAAAAADSDSDHSIANTMLRQFQTLSNDVRRNAEQLRGPH